MRSEEHEQKRLTNNTKNRNFGRGEKQGNIKTLESTFKRRTETKTKTKTKLL